MKPIAKTVETFGIMDKMPLYYSMALGAGNTTLFRMVAAYGMLDNGGHWLNASLIDLVQNQDGQIIYQKGTAKCAACYITAGLRTQPDNDPAYAAAGRAATAMSGEGRIVRRDHRILLRLLQPLDLSRVREHPADGGGT